MGWYDDIDPSDIDPDTGRPYNNYSSPALDTSFHDGEFDDDDEEESEEQGQWAVLGGFKVEHDFEDAGCGSCTMHSICTAPLGASATEIEQYVRSEFPSTHCQHAHDCCGNYYASRASFQCLTGEEAITIYIQQSWLQNI